MILLNNFPLTFPTFPNKEHYLPLSNLPLLCGVINMVKWVYEDDADFLRLAILKKHLDSINARASIHITYMPHSRMDRPNGVYAVSLNAALHLINSLNFSDVVVREPHSPATVEGLENYKCTENWCSVRINTLRGKEGYSTIFFPDFGAMERYTNVGKFSPVFTAYGRKQRDFSTGKITGLTIVGPVGSSVLIVDDICSKGTTFIEAAKLLKVKGARRIGLLVAYVEDNVFNGSIFDYIDTIYTSREREDKLQHPRITFID